MPANNMAATMAAMNNRIKGFLFTATSDFPARESAFKTLACGPGSPRSHRRSVRRGKPRIYRKSECFL
jgi:hypothetical protein